MDANGHEPQDPVPIVRILYRVEGGLQKVVGVEIAGQRFGRVIAAEVGVDLTRPGVPPGVARLKLEAAWPVEWKEDGVKDLLVATRVP